MMPRIETLLIALGLAMVTLTAAVILRPPEIIVVDGPAAAPPPTPVVAAADDPSPTTMPASDEGPADGPAPTNPELLAAADKHGISGKFVSALAQCTSDTGRIPIMKQTADELNRAYGRDLDLLVDADAAELASLYVIGSMEQLETTDPIVLARAFVSGNGAVERNEPPSAEAQKRMDCVAGVIGQ